MKTNERFIIESKEVHGDRYDYSLVEYTGSNYTVNIICPVHGKFVQRSDHHLSGKGCKLCSIECRKWSSIEFIDKSKEVHGDRYDYSLVEYTGSKTKIKIICPKHGIFEQYPNNHVVGRGCGFCGGHKKLTTFSFIEKSKKIHGDKYDYSLVNYIDNISKIKIICPIHGEFSTSPRTHLDGSVCKLCFFDTKKSNKLEFIEKSKRVHGYKYDYSNINYVNSSHRINIICPKHGEFLQKTSDHLKGNGCPTCSSSKGEIEIEKFLNLNKISFERNKLFEKCKFKRGLPFDFHLPKYNLCIEYDGEQHFRSIDFYGGDDGFQLRLKRDLIKTTFCEKNNINLIRIRFDENVEDILKKII